MRTLDVKVWEISEKRFVDYYSIDKNIVHVAIADHYFLVNDLDKPQENDEFIYCLFSGVTDKNDKKVYQGDVFHLGDPNITYVVEWIDCGLMGRQIGNKSSVGLTFWKERIEVIGNIHENPNLLTRK